MVKAGYVTPDEWHHRLNKALSAERALMPIETHQTHSQRLMEHAQEQLAKGDRLQASEKAWGAVAHQLKAIADSRGWKYDTHQQTYGIVRRLAAETEEPAGFRDLFSVAAGLHQNFYADTMPLEELAYEIGRARTFLDMLNRPEFSQPRGTRG